MKKRSKSIVVSLLMALAFGAMSVGTTFALFTSQAKTSIEVGTGKLNLTSSASGLKTYSCVGDASGDRLDELGNKYKSQLTTVPGVFTNGGTAELSEGANELELKRVTPGDRVAFDVDLGVGQTNIDFKYRVNFKYVGEDKTLAKGLLTTFAIGQETPETFKGLLSYTSEWKTGTPTSTLPSLAFDIELPIDKGNEYQEKNGGYLLTIQAVQGNAVTDDTDAYVSLISEDIVSPTVTADEQDTTVTASDTENNVSVTTTIPAAAQEVGSGDKVHLVVSDLAVSELPESHTGTMEFDATLYVNDVATSSFSQPVTVTIQLHQFLNIQSVKHNGTPITAYEYDANTGVLTFTTTSFSPFSVEYEKMAHNTMYHFYDSYVENGHWVHEVTDKATFKNIMAHISARGAQEAADTFNGGTVAYPLADKTTVYLLKNNINFGGSLWTSSELVALPDFVGTLQSATNENVVLSNVQASASANVIRSDWTSSAALFGQAFDATFKSITLRNMSLAEGTKGSGLFVAGNNVNLSQNYLLRFENCIVEASCSIVCDANAAAFVGSTRGIARVEFVNCINNADVNCTSSNVGGFVGTGTTESSSGTNKLTFVNCTNNGNITGTQSVGGFTGNTGNSSRLLTGYGNINNGNVYALKGSEDEKRSGFFFSGDSWYNSDSNFSGTNNGKLYLKIYDDKTASQLISGGTELSHINDDGYVIYDSDGETRLNSTTYVNKVVAHSIVELGARFNTTTNKLEFDETVAADRILVNIRQHGLRISKTEYWPAANPSGHTNEMGGAQQSETYAYMHRQVFNSFADVDITKVTMCGYFKPSDGNDPVASYNAGFETFLLNDSLAGQSDYANGYHVKNGVAYIVVANNDPLSDQYLAICDWRNDIQYEITAYKDGVIVGNSIVNYGRGSGDSTLLTPISL